MIEVLIIFFAKIVEVSLSTLRTVFITKGAKLYSFFIALVEITIWLSVVSRVIIGITEHPFKMIAYAVGYAVGQVVGITLEEKIGFGVVILEVIADREEGVKLTNILREKGVAVTQVLAEGMTAEKYILSMYIQRKQKAEVIKIIKEYSNTAMVAVNDVSNVYGGYGLCK